MGVTMANAQLVKVAGAAHAEALADIGILTASQLLEAGATSAGRMKIADTTMLDIDEVNRYVHMSDLLRVSGIGAELAHLLCEAGIATVPKLAYRDPDSVESILATQNGGKPVLSAKELERIIAEAKTLPKVIQH